MTNESTVSEDQVATSVLMTLHRLAQQSTLYDENNEAQRQAVKAVADSAQAYGRAAGRNASFHFSERAIYIGRRLLRGSRATYTAATQMRNLLAKLGASQISIGHDVPEEELRRLQAAFARAMKGSADPAAGLAGLTRIRLRAGRPPGEIADLESLSDEARAIKVYSLAIVIVRRFYEQLQKGHWEITSHVRRISEELIQLGGKVSPAILATTVCRPAHDDAERTVSAALLALCMAQQLTNDQRLLRWLATGALLCEVGKPRVAGLDPDGSRRIGLRSPILGEGQHAELPGATAFVTTALGRLTDAGMMRSVVVYEALHIENEEETGPIYDGERGPAMLSRLLACARRFQERLSKGNAAADVVAELVENGANMVDRWIVQLLSATLNVLPTGTIVELDDGHWARVVSPPLDRIDFGRPLVRLVGKPGAPIESRYVDLNQPIGNQAPPRITRIIAAIDDEQPELAEEVAAPAPAVKLEKLSTSRSKRIMPVGPVSDEAPDSDRPLAGAHVPRATLMARGEPKAKGTLQKSPVVHLLVYAADNNLEGTLLLQNDSERSAIYFRDGRPCKTQTKHATMKLADLEADDVDKRLRQHMVDEVGYMMQLPEETKFSFFAARDLLSAQPVAVELRGDPLPLIMMGVRKYMDYDAFDQVLPKVANVPLVLHERASPARLGLKPNERPVLMLLRERELTLNDMLADEQVDEDAAQRVIYAMVITRQLVLGDEKRWPVAHVR